MTKIKLVKSSDRKGNRRCTDLLANPIYAVIRGSAVNQDDQINGISVSNGLAQEAAVREACKLVGISPEPRKTLDRLRAKLKDERKKSTASLPDIEALWEMIEG